MTCTLRNHKIAILKIHQQNMVARGSLVLVLCEEGTREDAGLQDLSQCLLEQLKIRVTEDLQLKGKVCWQMRVDEAGSTCQANVCPKRVHKYYFCECLHPYSLNVGKMRFPCLLYTLHI